MTKEKIEKLIAHLSGWESFPLRLQTAQEASERICCGVESFLGVVHIIKKCTTFKGDFLW